MAPPILIGPLLLPTLLFSPLSPGICLFLVFCIPLFPFVFFSLDQSSFQHGHISAFPNVIFCCTTAQVIFTLFGATFAVLFKETEPQHTFLQGITLVFLHLFLPSLFLCFHVLRQTQTSLISPKRDHREDGSSHRRCCGLRFPERRRRFPSTFLER